jgi:KaiC/GvpD/RAD55 family RecA-like ATPase
VDPTEATHRGIHKKATEVPQRDATTPQIASYELMGEGLQKGKTYLVSGEAGTGKTVFCMQYLLHGLSLGENDVYLTVDEKPAHLVQDAAAFGWDLETPIDEGRLCIMDLTPEFSELR